MTDPRLARLHGKIIDFRLRPPVGPYKGNAEQIEFRLFGGVARIFCSRYTKLLRFFL